METQLELNLDDMTTQEFKMKQIQRDLEKLNDSMGKVRRKLFSELGEVKRLYAEMKKENDDLRSSLRELKNEKIEWEYSNFDAGYLFAVG